MKSVWIFLFLFVLQWSACTAKPSEQSEREGEAPRALPAEGATQAPSTDQVTLTAPPVTLDSKATLPAELGKTEISEPSSPSPLPPPVGDLSGGSVTGGKGEGTEEIPYAPRVAAEGQVIEIIVDFSGSMNGILGNEVKQDLIKNTLAELLQQWGQIQKPPIEVALRAFGHGAPIDAHDCNDTELLSPAGKIDADALVQSLKDLKAQGETPLTLSLREAAKDLSASTQPDKIIVVVADGADTCNQDPCTVIDELKKAGQTIIAHVIAFDVSQTEEAGLRCIAEKSGGKFFLARTQDELVTELDQAFRATIPYNLQLKVLVGGSPLPTTVTIYKQGSQEVVGQSQSYGVQLFRLPAGNYDLQVEYAAAPELKKPAKMIKGVQLTATGKVEQEIRFELAPVILSAKDKAGQPAKTRYTFYEVGSDKVLAQYQSDGTETHLYLTPGSYDLVAERLEPEDQKMSLKQSNVTLTMEQSYVGQFLFQTGFLVLKGLNVQKAPTGLEYKVTLQGQPATIISSGQTEKEGATIELPPGTYDVWVAQIDPNVQSPPAAKAEKITIEGGQTVEQTVTVITGTLVLDAVLKGDTPIPTQFQIVDAKDESKVIADVKTENGKVNLQLAPGAYTANITYTPEYQPKGITLKQADLKVEEGKTNQQKVVFELGSLKLAGRNIKKQNILTRFKVYKAGMEELLAESEPSSDWVIFHLSTGLYDILALDAGSTTDPKPTIWIRDVKIDAGIQITQEASFTTAKVKLMAIGTNNQVLKAQFRIFRYGTDSALFAGNTADDWVIYDIPAGNYYIEAGYVNKESSQLLKKWVTLKVAENEIVEKVLRF